MFHAIQTSVLIFTILVISGCASWYELDKSSNPPNLKAASMYNVQLGLEYFKQGNPSRAKTKLLTAIEQDPNSVSALNAMAYYLENTGNAEEARNFYLKAIENQPNSGQAHNNYGTFLCGQQQYAAAETQFLLASQNVNYTNTAEAYENAGLCSLKIPDFTKADKYFHQALAVDPNRSTTLLELGELSFKRGEYQQSLHYVDNYLQNLPPDPRSLWLGVRASRKLGYKNRAVSDALTLRTEFPKSREASYL